MLLRQIFEPHLAQYAYLIGCQRTGDALIIDPLRDIAQYDALAAANGLTIRAVAETHIHADFVSGSREFAQRPGIRLYLSGKGGADWSYRWPGDRANTFFTGDGEEFFIGNIKVRAVWTPGHTPEHMSYLITDLGGGADEAMALATGDFLFVGDVGRPDLLESAAGVKGIMEPSARALRKSLVEKLSGWGDYLQILPGHGAGSACGKALGAVPTTTLGYERRQNAALRLALKDDDAFVKDILSGQPEPPPYFATMKRVNRDGIAVTGGVPAVGQLSVEEFQKMMVDGGAIPIDTRKEGKAFDAAHVEGAIFAPLDSPFFFSSVGSYVGEDEPLVLLVENETACAQAIRQLYRIGYDNVRGWIAWETVRAAGLFSQITTRVDFPDFDLEKAKADGVILDVRTSAEFAQGHVDGAISIPYTRLRPRLGEVPEGSRIFVHCGSGKRAALAASFLQRRGFEVIHVDGVCAACEQIAVAQGVVH